MDWTPHLWVMGNMSQQGMFFLPNGSRLQTPPIDLREKPSFLEESQQRHSAGQGAPWLCLCSDSDEMYAFSFPVSLTFSSRNSLNGSKSQKTAREPQEPFFLISICFWLLENTFSPFLGTPCPGLPWREPMYGEEWERDGSVIPWEP